MVEFALSSVVLLLLVGGLVDIGRAIYVTESLSNAAREGARHAIWFDASHQSNPYLDDNEIQATVNAELNAIGLPPSVLKNSTTTCPATTDNTFHDPPYASSAYPPGPNQAWLYICYNNTPGTDFPSTPGTNESQQDVNVIVLYSYSPLTPIIGAQFGSFHLAVNQHMTVQG
jgi:Flp pilus assembly protein TadG